MHEEAQPGPGRSVVAARGVSCGKASGLGFRFCTWNDVPRAESEVGNREAAGHTGESGPSTRERLAGLRGVPETSRRERSGHAGRP